MKRTFTFLLAAIVGGFAAAALLLIAGFGGDKTTTTTVLQQVSGSASTAASNVKVMTPGEIYKRDAPGVAYITSQIVQQSQSMFGMPTQQQGEATGSGIVIDKNGTILTNYHVIQDAVKVTVKFGQGQEVPATVIGKDPSNDIALLKISPAGLDLHPLELGDSSGVQVGDPAVAIGNPFGYDRTLTTGVISALQRHIQAPNGFGIDNVIQTDAPINPGNSGGPLLDGAGKVIGINSQIATGGSSSSTGGSVGIGFAVPINTAKALIPQLEKTGSGGEAYLGISSLTVDGRLAAFNLAVSSGALVDCVHPGSPAEKAGIHAGTTQVTVSGAQLNLGGDIVVSVDGKAVKTNSDLAQIVGAHKPGDTATIGVVRGKQHLSLQAKLTARPTDVQSSPSGAAGGC